MLCLGFIVLNLGLTTEVQAQQIQVTSALPAAAEQGTVNLNVRVTGKGFKNGAKAKWFVSSTTDPGGVTVNSTTFVSSTELTANITVSDTAAIANFDIQVLNSDGRGGKGTELFAVTPKGQATCPPMQPAPTTDTKCYAASPGCLDSTLGGVGFVHTDTDTPAVSNSANATAVQPDGKIVAAGKGQFPNTTTSFDFVVVRYNGDGSLDTSFGDVDPLNPLLRRGYSVTYISDGADFANDLLLQPDGKIVVVGSASSGEMAAVRYNVDGTPDSTFGSGGKVLVTFGGKISAVAQGAALQSDGKIVMGGRADTQMALARLNSNGLLDSSFGTSGKLLVNPSGARNGITTALDVAVQRAPAISGEERIVLGGQSRASSQANREWTLMRLKPNGATDTTFGTSGIVKTSFFGFGESVMRVAIDSSNQIIATGFVYSSDPSQCNAYIQDVGVVRYTENGALDPSFGGGGKQTLDVYGGRDEPYGLALQTDGKIVMAGFSMSSDVTVQHILVVRLNVDGSLDSSFGPSANGIVTTAANRNKTLGYALALQPWDGKIVVAGQGWDGGNGNPTTIVVARYWP
jgi:uncharacterized delta-60 repeat protein